MKRMPLLISFKNPANLIIFAGFSLLFFGLNYLVMKNLPGTNGYQCLPNSINSKNIIFSIIISLVMGVFIVGMKEIFTIKKSAKKVFSGASIFSISGVIGIFTMFCPLCTIGIISIFGVSFGLNFLLDFNYEIKIISILILFFGLYWINGQLKQKCKICNFINKK